MAPRISIFLIAMGAKKLFYVKFIATNAPTFLGFIISVLAIVCIILSEKKTILKRTYWPNLYTVIATIQVAFLLRSKTVAEHVSMLSHAHREFWVLKFPFLMNLKKILIKYVKKKGIVHPNLTLDLMFY